jgi:hypothetical protein
MCQKSNLKDLKFFRKLKSIPIGITKTPNNIHKVNPRDGFSTPSKGAVNTFKLFNKINEEMNKSKEDSGIELDKIIRVL